MIQIVYKFIYNRKVNYFLRNILKPFNIILPKSLKIPPSGIIKLKNEKLNSLSIEINQTSYLGWYIFWNGYKNFEYTSIFIELAKKVNTFYDIGANFGYYSLISALENPNIKVVSFEPAKGPAFFLKKNIILNNFNNIKAETIALSDKKGILDFYEIKNKKYIYLEHCISGESNAGSLTSGRNFVIEKVNSITLDEYVSKSNDLIDLIKIDTEGTENLILSKSDHVLKNMKPIIICETLFNNIENELEKIMRSYDYEFYNHEGNGLVKVSTIIRAQDNGVRNCFFVHPSKKYLIEEFIVL